MANITQSLRTNIDSFTLESLFLNLLDELKRQESIDNNQVLYSNPNKSPKGNYKGKKPWKVTKGKYCRYCKQTSHITTDCAWLFPDKAPKNWKFNKDDKNDKPDKSPKPKSPKEIRDDNIDVLYSHISEESLNSLNDMEIDFNLDDIQVNITSHIPIYNIITNTTLDPINDETIQVFTTNNTIISNNTKFALDTAATKHIICNKSFFTDFKDCNKTVNWGQAKSVIIKGIGNVYIKFKDTNKAFLLKNCLYMPELGINLISQSELNSNYYTVFTKDNVYLKNQQNITITKGNKINGLYYLDIIPNNKERIFTITDAIINNNNNNNNNNNKNINKNKNNNNNNNNNNKNKKLNINKTTLY